MVGSDLGVERLFRRGLRCNIRFGRGRQDRRRNAMTKSMPRICIAMGDPAGISPELLAKLLARSDLMKLACVSVVGDRRGLSAGGRTAGGRAGNVLAWFFGVERAPAPPARRTAFVGLRALQPAG